jgi:hypothetical protein
MDQQKVPAQSPLSRLTVKIQVDRLAGGLGGAVRVVGVRD